MTRPKRLMHVHLTVGVVLCGLTPATMVQAGGFAIREQSAYYLGSAFAGSAAGDDISSMFWNSAAAASRSGCNASANVTALFGTADDTARAGLFVTGVPPVAPGITPTSADVAKNNAVPSTYATCQISDRLFAGLAINAPFGLLTKPESSWAGSPIAITSKVFTTDFNPTIAYRVTPELTVGVGMQVEFFYLKLTHGAFNTALGTPLTGSRNYEADDWSLGATAGLLWKPMVGTSIGLGYRSAVGIDVSGDYAKSPGLLTGPAISTSAAASVTLPDEVTLSIRHSISPRLALLGTIEWQNWSRVQNVTATGPGCAGGICEVLNLNYRDGWFYTIGAEYAYNPWLTLRTGIGYETSPIKDSTRDILVPDSNRIHLAVGGSYKYSDQITFDVAYSHLFFEDAPFCIASAPLNGGTSHCTAGTLPAAILLSGKADVSADLLAFGLKYKF